MFKMIKNHISIFLIKFIWIKYIKPKIFVSSIFYEFNGFHNHNSIIIHCITDLFFEKQIVIYNKSYI